MRKYIKNDTITESLYGSVAGNKVHFVAILFMVAIVILIINSGTKRTKRLDHINSYHHDEVHRQ